MNLTGCLTAVTGLRTAKLLCESASMCVSASMRVYESLELPSRQLCVWKSRETGNQLHVCMDCFPALVLHRSLSLLLLLLQKPPAFWPTGSLFEPFPFNIFLHKVCAWFLFNLFYCVAYTHTHTHICTCFYSCVCVCIVGCCLPLTGFHLKLAKATCGNCVRL